MGEAMIGRTISRHFKISFRLAGRSLRSNPAFLLLALVTVFGFISDGNNNFGVSGQSASLSCVCGVDRVPCGKNLTSSDCPNGRVIARRDCTCCFVCAKQLTEECNNIDALCDSDYGLECGMDKRCKAKTQCSDDTSCTNDLMCAGGACADPCKVLPDVCHEANITNGMCIAGNHRALCLCPAGKTLDSNKTCLPSVEEVKKCEDNGRKLSPGDKIYKDKCGKVCDCGSSGELTCTDVKGDPQCEQGFIPMSKVTGEMNEACKILIGNATLFDGCCLPDKCQSIKSQDHPHEDSKGSRDFKLTESHNNLGEEDEKSKQKVESIKEIGDATSSSSTNTNPKEGDGLKQVTVLKRTDHSAVIELPKNDKEAILSISLSKELSKDPGSSEVWKEHRIPAGLPQITLSDLMPNTSYTLKYSADGKDYPSAQFITDEAPKATSAEMSSSESSEAEDSTEVGQMKAKGPLSVKIISMGSSEETGSGSEESTLHPDSSVGCLYNGTSYELGEEFFEGCNERCECMKNGEVKCIERCSIPLFKKGSFAHDKMCFEEPSGIDDCCVFIACARGGKGAGEPRELISILPQACDSVKCAMNAHCLGPSGMLSDEEQQTNQTLCVCNEGFIGDPYDETQGCQQGATAMSSTTPSEASSSTSSAIPAFTSSTAKPEGCVFKNKTYNFGDEQFDGCSYKCSCETSGEFLCVPRCNYRRDEEKEIPAGCEVQKDPSDLECCEMLVCHGEPLKSGTRKDTPTVPLDGCVYKNKTYARDEKFYDGCDSQCMCYSNGDVTCQPRCPPAGSSGIDNCVTLPDPSDKCCTVIVCGNSTLSDVMKAANETESVILKQTTTLSPDMTTESSTTIIPASSEGRSRMQPPSSPLDSKTVDSASINIRISIIQPVNATAIKVSVQIPGEDLSKMLDDTFIVKYSPDLKSWKDHSSKVKDLVKIGSDELDVVITGLMPGMEYYFKARLNQTESNTASGFTRHIPLASSVEEGLESGSLESSTGGSHEMEMSGEEASVASGEKIKCSYKGKSYDYEAEFYDECESYCACGGGGKINCVKIDCPKDGLELVDDSCLRWEPDTKDFRREAPDCCPEMRCVQHSSCMIDNGIVFRNFEEIPQKITGCDKRCYCEFGNITCQNLCPPMTDHPPPNLPCPKEHARAVTLPHNECCYQWVCPQLPQRNESNGPKITQQPTMLNKTETQIPNDLINVNQTIKRPYNNGTHIFPQFDHAQIHDEDQDQFVPPSTGNQPTLVSLDKINPHQLQELLHQLSSLGEGGQGNGGNNQYTHAGTYVQVHSPQQVKELEKEVGAKFVEQAEDGSYILVIPNTATAGSTYQDQTYSDHLGHGHGPPYAHAAPPSGFPGAEQFPFGLNPFQRPPPGSGPHGSLGPHDRSKISNIVIHPLNESTLQIDFTVSPILVGLQGHVEVLYTSEFHHKPNPAQWDRKVFQQAEDLIDNTHLQLFLTSLKEDTEYHMQIKVVVLQADSHPTSDIIRVRTPPPSVPTTTLPPEILVDPEIQLTATESKSVKLHWRKFTDLEKDLIDGVQITYKANDEKVYSTTPLIHRSLDEYELENLQPDNEYEINLLFIPFDSNQTTILKSQKPIFVKTTPTEDDYGFDIAISHGKITETTVELIVDGVPHPEDKFVNIYQVIYMTDSQKEQKNYFKVPKRETSKRATLTDLKPGTNYTLWMEAFLTNGKKKRSNVIPIKTKDGSLPLPEKSGQDNLLQDPRASEQIPQTSYYGALVALAIVAALSIIGIIALLMILIKKQNYAKAPINDRKSESSYDNPSFKSYDIESNGHTKPGDL